MWQTAPHAQRVFGDLYAVAAPTSSLNGRKTRLRPRRPTGVRPLYFIRQKRRADGPKTRKANRNKNSRKEKEEEMNKKKKKKKKQEAKYTSRPQRGHVTCGCNGHHFISCSSAAPFLAATFQNTLLQHGTGGRSLEPPSMTTKVSKISHKPSHQHLSGLCHFLFRPPLVSCSVTLPA